MDTFLTNFHFVRPLWLLGCLPAVLFFGTLWFIRSRSTGWRKTINQALLPYLLDSALGKRQNWPMFIVLLAWLISCVSLAGPAWEKLPQPVQKKEDALVIIQDLSLSLYAQDLSPNRLARAQHKLTDILKKRHEGTTALVVYSGTAHVVSPLTDDSNTIAAMVPSLSPGIMPSYGSNVVAAVETALQLLKDTGLSQGRMLLLTDEVEKNDTDAVTKLLHNTNVTLAVLGIGTTDGGPIPVSDGGFLKDEAGNIIVPRLNRNVLQTLARSNHGRYSDIQLDDRDIDYLLTDTAMIPKKDEFKQIDREFDQWKEMGPWLLLLVLPVALLAFRKGWLLVFVVMISFSSTDCNAMAWQDLWQRKDQQAANALQNDDPTKAADLFQSPSWKGVAEYKAGNFTGAAEAFGQTANADNYFNIGNALAKAGNLEEAVKSYDKALQLDPNMEDAQFNKKLIEQLLQQQKQQQQQQNENAQNQESGEQEKQQTGQQKKNQQQQGQDQEQQNQEEQAGQKQNDQKTRPDDPKTDQAATQNNKDQEDTTAEKDKQTAQSKNNEPEDEKNKKLPSEPREKDTDEQQTESAMQSPQQDNMTEEEKQALEQWLRQVPDNPGGLLRRKFEYESRLQNGRGNTKKNTKIW